MEDDYRTTSYIFSPQFTFMPTRRKKIQEYCDPQLSQMLEENMCEEIITLPFGHMENLGVKSVSKATNMQKMTRNHRRKKQRAKIH